MTEQERNKTTFTSHMVMYLYSRMPLGLRNGPENFQRSLYIIHLGVLWRMCLIYIYDFIVFLQTKKND